MIKNSTEVISFKSEAVTGTDKFRPAIFRSPTRRAAETQALYADDNGCGGFYKAKPLKKLCSDDYICQTDHHGSCAGRDFKKAFLLAVYAAGQGCKAIGNCQTDDFYQPLVLSKRSD